jgi:membrane protein YdbS with pleckstrin-like domain
MAWWILDGLATVVGVMLCIVFPLPPVWIGVGSVIFAIFVYLFCFYLYQRLGVNYVLTTHKLSHKMGILRQVTDRIEIIDIDDVTYEQGLLERMLGIGTIIVTSSDTSHPKLAMRAIDDVQRVAGLIDQTAGDERRRRGAFVERV